jgi:hypothetical protein
MRNIPNSEIVFWNVNWLSLAKFVQVELMCAERKPLLVCLCECKIRDVQDVPSLSGYDVFAKPYRARESGLVVYVSNRVHASRRSDLENDSPHCMWLECALPGRSRKMLVGVCYRQASQGLQGFEPLLDSIRKAAATRVPFLLLGDFNCDHWSWSLGDSDSFGDRLFDLCGELGLSVLNSVFAAGVFTHRPSNLASGSVIDLAITSHCHLFADMVPTDSLRLISDHRPLLLSLASPSLQTVEQRGSSRPDFDHANWALYQLALKLEFQRLNADFVALSAGLHPQAAIDRLWSEFTAVLSEVTAKAIGYRRRNPDRKPWWSPSLLPLLVQYQRSRRFFDHHPGDAAARNSYWQYRRAWSAAVKSAKTAHHERQCALLEDPANGNIFWRQWASRTPFDACPVDQIQDAKGNLPESPQEGLNRLAAHFARQCSLPPENKRSESDARVCRLVDSDLPASDSSAAESLFTAAEVSSMLSAIPVNTAPGADSIYPAQLRHLPPAGVKFLTSLFNFSLEHAVLPREWKLANVRPLLKNRGLDRRDPANYRPISLTSVVCKLMERLLLPRLWRLAATKISRFQTGFRKGKSTLHNMFRLYSAVNHAICRPGFHISAAFLDLKAAFDRVWIPGLLWKLHSIGIRGRLWAWLKAFLTHRSIRVVHDSLVSDWFSISAGVPQGAVLSPFLFLVYIDDVVPLAEESGCEIALFADDIVVWPKSCNADGDEALQRFLDKLGPWAKEWKVLFGQKKSQVICFTRCREPPELKKFRLADFDMDFVDSYKYLGVLFQRNLKWKQHTQEVVRKANAVSAMIEKCIVPGKPPGFKCIRTLIESCLLPIVSYGLPIWTIEPEYCNELNRLIARPMMRLLRLPYKSSHALSVIVDTGLLSCDALVHLAALRFAYNIYSQPGPDICKLLLSEKENVVSATVRSSLMSFNFNSLDSKRMAHARDAVDQWQWDNWGGAAGGPLQLKGVKLWHGVSEYLLVDDRRTAVIRARLRHDRSSLNASLASRRVVPSPNCSACGIPETSEHCLLQCPRFALPRLLCTLGLSVLAADFNLATVLGDVDRPKDSPDRLPAAVRRNILKTTGSFLLEIDNIRRL